MRIQPNRHLRYKKKKKRRRILVATAFCFFLFCAVAAGAVWWKLENTLNAIVEEPSALEASEEVEERKTYNQEPISLVLIGTDGRANLGLSNTDVIIVAALNPQTKSVTMMPIPRDTGVKIPGYSGYHKINSVFARGESARRSAERNNRPVKETGPSLLKKTIEEALGIPIHHYVLTDFEGFQKVVDEVGGVEVEVDKSMRYHDPTDGTRIHLDPGRQVLNGEQALGFVRHRLDNRGSRYYSSDFDRGVRQQMVIKSLVDKMKSFTGIASFFNVLDVAGEHIRTDLSKEQIRGLILDFRSIGSENIVALDSGGYWDPASSHTIIPRENLEQIQLAFQKEMGIEGGTFRSTFRVEAPTPRRQQSTVVSNPPVEQAAPNRQTGSTSDRSTDESTPSDRQTGKGDQSRDVAEEKVVRDPSDSSERRKAEERDATPTPSAPERETNIDPAESGMFAPPVDGSPPGSSSLENPL